MLSDRTSATSASESASYLLVLGLDVAAARRMNAVSIRAEQSGLLTGSFSRQRPINSLNSGDHAPSFGSVGASASLRIVWMRVETRT